MKEHPGMIHPVGAWVRYFTLFSWVCLWGGFGVVGAAAWAASPDAVSPTKSKVQYHKVLFLGNSITLHGPNPAIGWSGQWGMAASAKEKDYVHLVLHGLTRPKEPAPESKIMNIATFERQYATADVNAFLKEASGFGADLIIVAIGENVPKLDSAEAKVQFKNSLLKLLRGMQGNNKSTIVVRSCFWANKDKDQMLKEACQEVGGIFVDISSLGKDESNYARSERKIAHSGVAAHPGDKGMQAIAKAILEAIELENLQKRVEFRDRQSRLSNNGS